MKTWARQSVSIQRKLIYTAIHIHTYVHYAHYIIHTCTCTTHAHTCTHSHVCIHVCTYTLLPHTPTHTTTSCTHTHTTTTPTHSHTHTPQPIPVPTSLTANTTIHSFAPLTHRCLQTLTPQAVKALHAQVPQVFMQFVVASNALNRLQSPHMTLPYH